MVPLRTAPVSVPAQAGAAANWQSTKDTRYRSTVRLPRRSDEGFLAPLTSPSLSAVGMTDGRLRIEKTSEGNVISGALANGRARRPGRRACGELLDFRENG